MNKLLIILSCFLLIALIAAIADIIYINYIKIDSIKEQAVFDNIHSRKSVRHYIKDKEISKENIDKILKAGMAAPSARNLQPWEIIVINDKEILKSLAAKNPSGKMLDGASLGIVVAADTRMNNETNEFWIQDTSAVTENILLAIEALKLGAVWIGAYPKEERVKIISEELNLPDYILPLNIIAIGYPTGEDKPKDKWNIQKVHYNKF